MVIYHGPGGPKVTSETPASGATNVAVSTTATATFNEAVQSSTISFTLTPSGGSPVAATVGYNSATYTVTLTPERGLGLQHDLHRHRQRRQGHRGRSHERSVFVVIHHGPGGAEGDE